jgi:hypothetical protein
MAASLRKKSYPAGPGSALTVDRVQLVWPDGPVGCTFIVWLAIDPAPTGSVCVTLDKVMTSGESRPKLEVKRAGGLGMGVYYIDLLSVSGGGSGTYLMRVCLPDDVVDCDTLDCEF